MFFDPRKVESTCRVLEKEKQCLITDRWGRGGQRPSPGELTCGALSSPIRREDAEECSVLIKIT